MPDSQKFPVIGLVGGIGSGKSLVGSLLRDAGCLVANSDELVRRQLDLPEVRAQLEAWWGRGILDDRGGVDRRAVSAIVFRDPAERARLEAFLHPRIEAARRALVIDAPLLLEAGLAPECTAIWFVDTPEQVRRGRVLSQRGWSAEELDRREAAQWSLDRKRAASHHVLRNDGDPASLREQVLQALGQLPATA